MLQTTQRLAAGDLTARTNLHEARGEWGLLARELGFRSAMIVPLRIGGRTIGAVTLVFTESSRHFDHVSMRLAERLAEQAVLAAEKCRRSGEAPTQSSALTQPTATVARAADDSRVGGPVRTAEKAVTKEVRPTDPTPSDQVCILVVDDEAPLRRLIRRVLERDGYNVLVAEDGVEGLKVFEETPRIDLLLTDVMLPRMDGRELGKRVAEMRPGIIIVYMSGMAGEETGLGDVLYLEKPFTPDSLSSKIAEILGR